MGPVELRGARVLLRELRADDFDAIRKYAEDPDVHRYTVWQVDEPEDTLAYLEKAGDDSAKDSRERYLLGICCAETDELVGSIGIYSRESAAEIGYALNRDHWGRGFGSEATSLVIRFAFESLGKRRLFAECEPANQASARVMQKNFMRFEGLALQDQRVAGRWRDTARYAILADEWRVFDGFATRAQRETGEALHIERHAPERAQELHDLMRVVGQDLIDRFGMDHWKNPFSTNEIAEDARRRETYSARAEDGTLVGTFTIGLTSIWLNEPGLPWSPAERPTYLNRLMVHPSRQSNGVGRLMMLVAEDIARARGADAIRLETRTDFDEVQRFYKRLGYIERYTHTPDDWAPWNALDKSLDVSG